MNVLVIAPHPDDDILGVGGTMARAIDEGDVVFTCVVTNGYVSNRYSREYIDENRKQYEDAIKEIGAKSIYLEFPTMHLGQIAKPDLNDAIKEVIDKVEPCELYIPHWGDLHEEHRIVCESALVASRPDTCVKRIYAYEVPSETGWSEPTGHMAFIPNTYINITATISRKIKSIKAFKQQLNPNPKPRSIHAIISLAGYRGSQIGVEYAEAFELIREVK